MIVVGAGGVGGARGGGDGHGPPLPPRIFAKVSIRYAHVVLLVTLHDLLENYIKTLPKFTREGDLTFVKHINFFYQFVDIFGLEHEHIYLRLLVQNFEGQVRTWF
jgi:hypothetical protein